MYAQTKEEASEPLATYVSTPGASVKKKSPRESVYAFNRQLEEALGDTDVIRESQ